MPYLDAVLDYYAELLSAKAEAGRLPEKSRGEAREDPTKALINQNELRQQAAGGKP